MERFLFPVPPPSYDATSYPRELLWIPYRYPVTIENKRLVREPGDVCIPALFLNFPSARYLIVFFHSNAEDIGRTHTFCTQLREQFHSHVLAVEYPGYGIAHGDVSPSGVLNAADAALRFVREVLKWPDDSILIMGRSIGTAPAMYIASKYPNIFGLVLVSPFTSITALLEDKLGTLAKLLPIKEPFENSAVVSNICAQTMIIHGKKDILVPVAHGRQLFDALSCRKLFVAPVNMTHNTYLFQDPRLMAAPMLHFFNLPDYSISDDFRVPLWAFDKRLASNIETPREVEWNSKAFAQSSDVTFPSGDIADVVHPITIEKFFANRPPRNKGDGAVEDVEALESKLGLNYTQTQSLSGLSVRLPINVDCTDTDVPDENSRASRPPSEDGLPRQLLHCSDNIDTRRGVSSGRIRIQ